MKKSIIFICAILLGIMMILLTGCTSKEEQNNDNNSIILDNDNIVLDYDNAATFEKDLNSGKKVKGKIVKFDVKEYKPKSALGINCWAGEHLNFISDDELEVEIGDFIIGRVKEEPTKTLGSWKIRYDVIEIQNKNQEVEETENTNEKKEEIKETENIANENIIENIIEDDTKIEENIETNHENEINEETKPITYNYYTTNDNETAKNGNVGKYSYVKRNGSYKVYWVIDFDEGYVYDFTEGNGDESCERIKIKSGNLNDGLELAYKNSGNAWVKYIHFKYTNQPHQLIIVDNDYFEYEYSTTSLEETLKLMENKTIWEP